MPSRGRLHHILRIDNPSKRYHAWVVQVTCRKQPTVRSFSDRPHGGKRKALSAAIRFRDALLEKANKEQYREWRYHHRRADNTSGIIGVGRYIWRTRYNSSVYEIPAWQAYWNDRRGKRHSRWFSVARYGEERAKALAIRVRQEALRAILKEAAGSISSTQRGKLVIRGQHPSPRRFNQPAPLFWRRAQFKAGNRK